MTTPLASNDFLNTVPKHNYLHLFDENAPKDVVKFLELDRYEVAKAMGLKDKSQVRFDEQMRRDLRKRLEEIAIICELMAGYFNGDVAKTALWFRVKKPCIGWYFSSGYDSLWALQKIRIVY